MSARSRINRVFDAYNKNPVKDVEAHLIQGGDEDGIHFVHHVREGFSSVNKYYVNVYSDGSISIPMVESDLETLKVDDPVLYDLVMVISNDLRILELRERNTKSYIFDDSYDAQVVEGAMKDWCKTTGCFVCLDEEQKAALYNGLLCREENLSSSDARAISSSLMKQWFRDHDIPFIPTGSVTITVNGDESRIRFISDIKVSGKQTHHQEYTYKMDADCTCDEGIRDMAGRLFVAFGIPVKKG